MITYVYETIPQKPGAKTHHYLFKQNSGDAPLSIHPETAEPIRRLMLGELGELILPDRELSAENQSCSSSGCGCGRLPWLRYKEV